MKTPCDNQFSKEVVAASMVLLKLVRFKPAMAGSAVSET
jgi:hypothetical protein